MQPPSLSPFGRLLRSWRATRHLSQLDLALDADTSARHISFIETGRAQPSREMVVRLAETMDVPLRARNALLTAAGYAPLYRATSLEDAEMAQVHHALDFLLKAHEPYPAFVLDHRWDLVRTNNASAHFMATFGLPPSDTPPNVLRLLLHPDGLRPFIANWDTMARLLLQRAHREALRWGHDEALQALLEEIAGYSDMPSPWLSAPDAFAPPVLSLTFEKDGVQTSWFSTISSFGTPHDITVQELYIETMFPADAATQGFVETVLAEAAC